MSSHSVVRLTSPDPDAENGERLGTGFLVHLVDGEGGRARVGVLTACHNLPHHPAPQVETLHVHAFYAPQSRFEELNVASLLRFDPEEDWALLELGSSADEVRQACGLANLTLPTLEALRPGDLEFTTLGYPERDRAHPDAGRILASDAPDARARRAITVVGSDHPRAAPGYSGAPLWSTRRTVVGLVRQGVRAGNANRYTALGAGRLLEVVGHELRPPPQVLVDPDDRQRETRGATGAATSKVARGPGAPHDGSPSDLAARAHTWSPEALGVIGWLLFLGACVTYFAVDPFVESQAMPPAGRLTSAVLTAAVAPFLAALYQRWKSHGAKPRTLQVLAGALTIVLVATSWWMVSATRFAENQTSATLLSPLEVATNGDQRLGLSPIAVAGLTLPIPPGTTAFLKRGALPGDLDPARFRAKGGALCSSRELVPRGGVSTKCGCTIDENACYSSGPATSAWERSRRWFIDGELYGCRCVPTALGPALGGACGGRDAEVPAVQLAAALLRGATTECEPKIDEADVASAEPFAGCGSPCPTPPLRLSLPREAPTWARYFVQCEHRVDHWCWTIEAREDPTTAGSKDALDRRCLLSVAPPEGFTLQSPSPARRAPCGSDIVLRAPAALPPRGVDWMPPPRSAIRIVGHGADTVAKSTSTSVSLIAIRVLACAGQALPAMTCTPASSAQGGHTTPQLDLSGVPTDEETVVWLPRLRPDLECRPTGDGAHARALVLPAAASHASEVRLCGSSQPTPNCTAAQLDYCRLRTGTRACGARNTCSNGASAGAR